MIRLRTKLVQFKQQIGFDYFQRIQRRKNYFLEDAKSKELIMRLAIREPLRRAGYLREMEVRIVPGDTAEKILHDILELESTRWETDVMGQLDDTVRAEQERFHRRYYSVLHFTKQGDQCLLRMKRRHENDPKDVLLECRHEDYRKKVEKITRAVMLFRERCPEVACRVLGIDACSQEIGCRPEVFAVAYRTLGEHTCFREVLGQQTVMPRLRKIYYFLDRRMGSGRLTRR